MKKLLFLSAMALIMLASCQKNEPVAASVNDVCGNSYKIVTIGTQTWMAENLKCNKYDTQSEAYNAAWLTNNTIPVSTGDVYTPNYTDAKDQSMWSTTEYAGNLTSEQIAKLGYLYNWAAAVGVADGQAQTSALTGIRQGICPNGWHVPSRADWQILGNYIDGNNGGIDAGAKLKTTSGWFSNGNGTDSYGFAGLPAGYSTGSNVESVGEGAFFWTITSSDGDNTAAYVRSISYNAAYLIGQDETKSLGLSVRCLKN